MANLIGDLPFFYSQFMELNGYINKLNMFFDLNEIISEEKKCSFLIISVNIDIHTMLRDACHPKPLTSKTYTELVDILQKLFVVKKTCFRERLKFYAAKQEPDEKISKWLERVYELSTECKFRDRLDEEVRDKFICGLLSPAMLTRLCDERMENLTLRKAVQITTNMEGLSKKTADDLNVGYLPDT